MFLKTILRLIITIFLTTSPLLYSDSTNNNIDTSTPITESQLVEGKEYSEISRFSISDIKADHVFSGLIVVIMFFTLLNGWQTRKVQKQMADIQETNVKISLIPQIQNILNILDSIAHVDLTSFQGQLNKNRDYFNELYQFNLYLSESDGITKAIIDIRDKIYTLTGKIGERSDLMNSLTIEEGENERREELTKELSGSLIMLQLDIADLREKFVKRFRINY